jgi:hypothetical protein
LRGAGGGGSSAPGGARPPAAKSRPKKGGVPRSTGEIAPQVKKASPLRPQADRASSLVDFSLRCRSALRVSMSGSCGGRSPSRPSRPAACHPNAGDPSRSSRHDRHRVTEPSCNRRLAGYPTAARRSPDGLRLLARRSSVFCRSRLGLPAIDSAHHSYLWQRLPPPQRAEVIRANVSATSGPKASSGHR